LTWSSFVDVIIAVITTPNRHLANIIDHLVARVEQQSGVCVSGVQTIIFEPIPGTNTFFMQSERSWIRFLAGELKKQRITSFMEFVNIYQT